MGNLYDKRTDAEIMRVTYLAIEGLSYQAIAKAIEKTPGHVKGKVKAGLRRIGMGLYEARNDKEAALNLLKQSNT
jgi:DNA-directed RNA polymerase specialized sigma24 family protein